MHYGHNVAGYLPEADVGTCDTWAEAKSGLADDIKFERDGLDYAPEDADLEALYLSLGETADALRLSDGPSFLSYTDDGRQHTIPTAWWISLCGEGDECETWQAEQAEKEQAR
jgi:hypothetical protein